MPDFKYGLGDMVFLRCALEPRRGMVTGLVLRGSNRILEVTWEDETSDHYEMELATEFKPNYKDGSND